MGTCAPEHFYFLVLLRWLQIKWANSPNSEICTFLFSSLLVAIVERISLGLLQQFIMLGHYLVLVLEVICSALWKVNPYSEICDWAQVEDKTSGRPVPLMSVQIVYEPQSPIATVPDQLSRTFFVQYAGVY